MDFFNNATLPNNARAIGAQHLTERGFALSTNDEKALCTLKYLNQASTTTDTPGSPESVTILKDWRQ